MILTAPARRSQARLAIVAAVLATGATAAAAPPLPTRTPHMTPCCSIVELRQYTTYPGTRDALIALFEREFIESQEATGMQVIAQFRDRNDPDRFVWLRGFPDMTARGASLAAFYGGPLWKAHRDAANATLYDNDNVLLLHPAGAATGFTAEPTARSAVGRAPAAADFVVVTIYYFARPVSGAFVRWFDDELAPRFTTSGASVIAELVSDHSPNTFPRLPVREGENAFVWIARFADRAAYDRYQARLADDPRWRGELFAALHKQLARYPEVMMLEPTPRSLRHTAVVSRAAPAK